MVDAKKKQLAFNIIDFLRTSAQDGTVKEDDKESLEVAVQVIAESFGVDPDSASDKEQYSLAPASLLSMVDLFNKTKAKSAATSASGPSTAGATPSAAAVAGSGAAGAAAVAGASVAGDAPVAGAEASGGGPSEADKKEAEALKVKGNALMGQKLYDSAIEQYTEAIKLDANPVYYSNRAAAWGGLGEHAKAAEDAERALEIDPKFSKAYSRLGHAQFSLGKYAEAVDAYESGLRLDPANSNMKTALATAKARQAEEAANSSASIAHEREAAAGAGAGAGGMPDLSALAGLMGGAGGGAGMPDLASMMRNPQMMAMAQQMMANGGLERLMQNPSLRQMAERFQSGGGMPDMAQLASDPSLRDMAQQFMGGRGA